MNISAYIPHPFLKISTLALLAVMCQTVLLSGCATQSELMVKQVNQQTSDQQLIQQVMAALKSTEARLAKAQADNVGTYAPSQLNRAEIALMSARRYTDRFQVNPKLVNEPVSLFMGDTMGKETLALIEKANNALSQAEDNKKQADAIFVKVNENFTWLNKFQANIYFPGDYQELKQDQKQLVEYVANGNMADAQKGLPQLLAGQSALEIISAQRFYLYDLTQQFEQEEGGKLERYAPISYSSAVGELNKAKAVVAQDPRNEKQIQAAKASAEFSFEVAHAVAADMHKLAKMDRREMERWLILVATKLKKVGNAVGVRDVRNHELIQQLDMVAQAANSDKLAQPARDVATSKPTNADKIAAASEPAAASDSTAVNERMSQLEKTISEQIKALSEKINAMQKVSVSAKATPASGSAESSN